jgi:hypothetical protein
MMLLLFPNLVAIRFPSSVLRTTPWLLLVNPTHNLFILVDGVIIVEEAGILSGDIQLNSKGTESLASDTVRVDSSNDIRTSLMDGAVDHKSGGVDGVHVATLNDFALFVDKNEVGDTHVLERLEEGIDPKVVGQDGITDRNVSCATLVTVAVVAEPSEGLLP